MGQVNKPKYVEFRITDTNGNPVTTRDLNATTVGQRMVIYFTRDLVSCSDAVTLVNWGQGRYYATYTPTAVGHDYLEIYDELYDIRIIDVDDISPEPSSGDSSVADVVTLTQDYGAPDRFKVFDSNPSRFSLMVFNSFDWQSGKVDSTYALTGTLIDGGGNWAVPQLTLNPGTYHIVIRDRVTGETRVLATFLKLEL